MVRGYSVSALGNSFLYLYGWGDDFKYGFGRLTVGGANPTVVQAPGGKPTRFAWSDDVSPPRFQRLPALPG